MRNWKQHVATLALAICAVVGGESLASAQIQTYYSPGYAVPVYGPSPVVYAPQVVVSRPVVTLPPVPVPIASVPVAPAPVITAYRPVVPTYVAPAAVYSAYSPVYSVAPAPVYVPPAYGTVTRYRTGVVGAGLGGVPSVYTPGQPVRNALRYVVP